VESWGPELLHAHPRPGKWSIQEIVEHLVLAEEDVFLDLDDLERLEDRPRRPKNRLLYFLVMFILRYGIPVEAPSRAMLPTGDSSLSELRHRWEWNHARLGAYLAGLSAAGARRAVFRHPVTGPLTVRQAIRMVEVHLDRHIRQIRTLERLYRDAERG